MTTKEKAKAYDALEKAKEHVNIKGIGDTVDLCKHLFPQLYDSEDEKIRKDIINLIYWLKGNPSLCSQYYNDRYDGMLAYLERQKECVSEDFESIWKTEDCKTLLDEGEKLSPRFKEMFKEVCHSWYDKGIEVGEKQKEQKPAEWSDEDEEYLDGIRATLLEIEDSATKIDGLIESQWVAIRAAHRLLGELKSIRPQPIQLKEAYKDGFQTARYVTALAFINYLDENRPEGKMNLSNAECEDIDKAFKENDWAKILRYAEKYGKEN